MKKYYSSERLKEITFTNEIKQDLCIYDRKNQDKMITLIHDMDLEIEQLQQRIDKAIEYIEDIIERFNKINDKELISNRLVDIECIEKLFDILRGDE